MNKFLKPFIKNYALACSKDELRPDFQYIAFKDGYLYCTDAHIAVKARLDFVNNIDSKDIDLFNNKFMHKDCFNSMFTAKGALSFKIEEYGFVLQFEHHTCIYRFSEENHNFDTVIGTYEECKNRALQESNDQTGIRVKSDIFNNAIKVLDGQFITVRKSSKHNGAYLIYTSEYNYEDQALILMPHVEVEDHARIDDYKKILEDERILKMGGYS